MQATPRPVVISASSFSPHPFYPDLSVFLTEQWSITRLFLGTKVTPADKDEDRFTAHYYRELDGTIVVEFWQSACVLEGIGDVAEMSCAEFAWLLGYQVDDLSVLSAVPEFDSDQSTRNTLFPFPQVPNAEHNSTGLEGSAIAHLDNNGQPRKPSLPFF